MNSLLHRPGVVPVLMLVLGLVFGLGGGLGAAEARADSVLFSGSTIPMRGCRIHDIRGGRIYFRNASGRLWRREIDEVAAVGFDGLVELDEAERLFVAGDDDGGLQRLLLALLKTQPTAGDHAGGDRTDRSDRRSGRRPESTDTTRGSPESRDDELRLRWLRLRLIRAHDARGEYVQAAGHAAALFMASEETYWRHMEPLSDPNLSSYAAARETMDQLLEARRVLINGDLRGVTDRMMRDIQPIHDKLASEYDGPAIEPGSTVSGYAIAAIRAGRLEIPGTDEPPGEQPGAPSGVERGGKPDRPSESPPARPEKPAAGAPALSPPIGDDAPDAPDAIDAMLSAGRFNEALGRCERLAKRPGPRSLGRFLHQYGRALAGVGRSRDAVVMFLRCAILYDSSSFVGPSFLAAAAICRDEFADHTAARRLAGKAIVLAAAPEHADLAERARVFLSTLDPAPSSPNPGR